VEVDSTPVKPTIRPEPRLSFSVTPLMERWVLLPESERLEADSNRHELLFQDDTHLR
jgi:hypothetical protein